MLLDRRLLCCRLGLSLRTPVLFMLGFLLFFLKSLSFWLAGLDHYNFNSTLILIISILTIVYN